MKLKKWSYLSAIVFSLSTIGAVHADDISLGMAGYGGTGCPAGSASVTLSPDFRTLSLIFDSYTAMAGPSNNRTLDRKTCSVAIPVHVPQGLSVSIIDVDYRGYVGLPYYGNYATFASEYFFAGSTGPKFVKRWTGPTDTEYLFQNTLALAANVWSACGADVNMRVNTSILVRNYSNYGDALASVDSADFKAGIIYKLAWRRCYN